MSDPIERADAINAINCWFECNSLPQVGEGILYGIPSADRPQKVVAQITFDEEKLREIVKEAVERFKEEYEIIDRPQGEWTEGRYGDSEWASPFYKCSICGKIVNLFQMRCYNFCPNCGSRMREGADDE